MTQQIDLYIEESKKHEASGNIEHIHEHLNEDEIAHINLYTL